MARNVFELASVAAAAALLTLGGSAMPAYAADLGSAEVVEEAPPPTAAGSRIHGFFESSFKNDYITPRGLLVTNTGLTSQYLMGLTVDLYSNNHGFINNVSVTGGVWNDLWSKQNDPHVGSWNEFDWFTSISVKFAKDWTIGATYIEFLPPAADLPTSFPSTERNWEFSLGYSDAKWWGSTPFALNPYAKLFYEVSGPSTVVFGKKGGTNDIELGMVPTYDFKKFSLSVPTWVTVGPSSYWNNGKTGCGALATSPCSLSNAGVFSTGLTAKVPLDFIPVSYGKWYVTGGYQYYHILNDSLLLAQTATGTATSFSTAHRDVNVFSSAIGFTW